MRTVNKLKKTDGKFIGRHACSIEGCDENFVFSATQAQVDNMGKEGVDLGKFISAKCEKCGKQTLMSKTQYARWKRIFTGGRFEVKTTKFDQLFDSE